LQNCLTRAVKLIGMCGGGGGRKGDDRILCGH
jgi:hypothetical protein